MVLIACFGVLGKTYTSVAEEERRQRIFAENLLYIQQHNRQYELGQSSYYLGVNEYTDLVRNHFLSIQNITLKEKDFVQFL